MVTLVLQWNLYIMNVNHKCPDFKISLYDKAPSVHTYLQVFSLTNFTLYRDHSSYTAVEWSSSCACSYGNLALHITGHHHRWHKVEDEDSEGSNYSGSQEGMWDKNKRKSVVSDEDYRSSEGEEEDEEDGIM